MNDKTAAPPAAPRQVALALAATVALNLPLGTVYAFSVFLRPLEATLGVSRAELSFVFGLALVSFTAGMNLGPALYRLAAAWVLVAGSSLVAALGMALAATAPGILQLALGYGVLFGLGGGVAYVLLLQGVNLMLNGRRGLVNGFIISLYPLGAMLAVPVFGWALGRWGLRPTLGGLAVTLALAGMLSTLLVVLSRMVVAPPARGAAEPFERHLPLFLRLWTVFFLAATAGLTVLGQASAMMETFGGGKALALGATTAITACIAATRIGGGWLADRFAAARVMVAAHALSLCGATLLLAFPGPWLAAATLMMIGIGYGFVSGSVTAAIGEYWGPTQYGRIAGRLYIAWCTAAITLPVVAARLFDLSGSYAGALMLAAAGNLLGMVVAAQLPRRGTAHAN
jgi:MFS family permease